MHQEREKGNDENISRQENIHLWGLLPERKLDSKNIVVAVPLNYSLFHGLLLEASYVRDFFEQSRIQGNIDMKLIGCNQEYVTTTGDLQFRNVEVSFTTGRQEMDP